MGRCATCGKRIGLFFGAKWRKLDGAQHCTGCVPGVLAGRKERTEAAIFADGEFQVLFFAPVLSRDLDFPGNARRYTGALLLTDKGAIFAQHGEYKKAQDGGLLFGVIGALADGAVEGERRYRAVRAAEYFSDPTELIRQAEQLFFFPLDQIRVLKCSRTHCDVKLHKGSVVFQWSGGAKEIKPHLELLKAYAHAVTNRRDVVADCSPFREGQS